MTTGVSLTTGPQAQATATTAADVGDPAAPLLATARGTAGAPDPAAAPLLATSEGGAGGDAPARALLPDALRTFTAAVDAAAAAGAWAAPTPSGWDVRGVVAHVAAQQRRVPHVLAGAEPPARPADDDGLGADPRRTWRAVSAASTVAWAGAAQDATVRLRGEQAPASELAERLLLDLVVHGCDVRRAVRATGAPAPEPADGGAAACAAHALAWARAHQRLLTGSGHFGTPQEAGSDEPLPQLLALTGRRA
ncbi:maleylpyruvate isomerase N-terminal domain-containing protein [Pseudokineococcus sp. 1T1Z-3]|uniref:maleylpyruvate isomerase N-terminal domain-containing protein n=1 Tax=Pseudokineococcus sp. 1T1Z-3 TaxID=3132745 RepID=UPI00309F9D92